MLKSDPNNREALLATGELASQARFQDGRADIPRAIGLSEDADLLYGLARRMPVILLRWKNRCTRRCSPT